MLWWNWFWKPSCSNYIHDNCWLNFPFALSEHFFAQWKIATRFNQVVAMDLHLLDNILWISHNIWLFSLDWSRRWILHHHSREFTNEMLQTSAGKYSFIVKTTPSCSSFCNVICEQHNSTLTRTVGKFWEDHPKLAWDSSLALRKLFSSVKEASPQNQIVFGHNLTFPNLLTAGTESKIHARRRTGA